MAVQHQPGQQRSASPGPAPATGSAVPGPRPGRPRCRPRRPPPPAPRSRSTPSPASSSQPRWVAPGSTPAPGRVPGLEPADQAAAGQPAWPSRGSTPEGPLLRGDSDRHWPSLSQRLPELEHVIVCSGQRRREAAAGPAVAALGAGWDCDHTAGRDGWARRRGAPPVTVAHGESEKGADGIAENRYHRRGQRRGRDGEFSLGGPARPPQADPRCHPGAGVQGRLRRRADAHGRRAGRRGARHPLPVLPLQDPPAGVRPGPGVRAEPGEAGPDRDPGRHAVRADAVRAGPDHPRSCSGSRC